MTYKPRTRIQILLYAQGIADAINQEVFIQENPEWFHVVTADALNPQAEIWTKIEPNKEVLKDSACAPII